MKFQEFSYDVRAEVEISLGEVELLRELAQAHYDHTCKDAALTLDQLGTVVDSDRAAKQGGFLYGWRNQVSEPPVPVGMTISQVNLCCKILEMVSYFKPSHPHYKTGRALDQAMTALFHKLNDEIRRKKEDV